MIYLDNGATSSVKTSAYEEMLPYFTEYYGNPSGIYNLSEKSAKAMENSREHLASLIGADMDEIYFTSGGTEADNWALKSTAEMLGDKGRHIITTKIEHKAVLNSCKYLETKGYTVTYLDVDEYGMVRLDKLKAAIRKDTILISVMMGNNEIGTIQPIEEIGRIARRHNILFHTDAVQACGHIPIDVKNAHIDMLSASGHKFGGPKGIGFLYIRKGINLPSFIHGGGQESYKRAGTENVPAIVAMGMAAKEHKANMGSNVKYVINLREYAINRVLREIPYVRLNGHRLRRLPGNMSFSFQFVNGEAVQVELDMKGICVSTGSACSAKETTPSYVLISTGLNEELAYGTVRMTINEKNTKAEIDKVVEELKTIVFKQRQMSTEYKEMINPYIRYARRR